VVFVDCEPVLYLERGGRGIVTLSRESTPAHWGAPAVAGTPARKDAPLAVALRALADAVRAGRVDAVALERVDGEPAVGSELEPALVELGFRQGPRRLTLRA
jgi:ATP-dependent Lhr-like helicase